MAEATSSFPNEGDAIDEQFELMATPIKEDVKIPISVVARAKSASLRL
jgi:hypothetical protein